MLESEVETASADALAVALKFIASMVESADLIVHLDRKAAAAVMKRAADLLSERDRTEG